MDAWLLVLNRISHSKLLNNDNLRWRKNKKQTENIDKKLKSNLVPRVLIRIRLD